MTQQQLIKMGFKKKVLSNGYWYELSFKGHRFITNDSFVNEQISDWFVGYQPKKDLDVFWFNENLSEEGVFKVIFRLLTGYDFKLAHQKGLKKQILSTSLVSGKG